MKFLICPDSFKGSLSAREASDLMEKAILDATPDAETVLIPVADGGEGTIEALGAQVVNCRVNDAFFQPIDAFWGKIDDTAVIELAACAGLPQAKVLNPEISSTFGVGELILNALDAGFTKFIVALGGSSTNDFACGLASALGVRFLDSEKNEFIPTGGTLSKIASIDLSVLDPRVKECQFTVMCDVTNPISGPHGAAHVFAPQKGADEEMVLRLDAGLESVAKVVKKDLGIDVTTMPGGGAAGGCGAGLVTFLGAELKSGIDVVLDVKHFDENLSSADFVFTGEGKFDFQSVDGKAISGIANRCKKQNKPLIVFAGNAAETVDCYDLGVTAVFSIQRKAVCLEEAMKINDASLYRTVFNVARLLNV